MSNIAGPTAGATANNTNQQVQVNNNGAPSRQHFGKGVSCNGTTMTITTLYLGNDTHSSEYTRSGNWGVQLGFAIPLDASITELCKDMARKRLSKDRLDYELVRALKCSELYDKGYMFRPSSPMSQVCSDVVSIAAYQKFQPDDPVPLQDASYQQSLKALKLEQDALEQMKQQASQQQKQSTQPLP